MPTRSNIEVHARMVAAVKAREVPVELLARDFRMTNRVAAAISHTYRGADGWREWMSDLFEVFAGDASYDVDEIIACGDDVVAAMFRAEGHSAHSGAQLEFLWAGVTWFRDGRAVCAASYGSRALAERAIETGAQRADARAASRCC